MHSSHTKKIISGFYNQAHIKLKQFVFCTISSVVSCDGSALHLRWPREGTHQNTPYAGPDHAVPTPIHILPARELVVTTHPFTLSSSYLCHQKNTVKDKPPLSTHLTAVINTKPPLSLGKFNKSTPYFVFHFAV